MDVSQCTQHHEVSLFVIHEWRLSFILCSFSLPLHRIQKFLAWLVYSIIGANDSFSTLEVGKRSNPIFLLLLDRTF
jgi:hypothetical protein